MPFSLLLHGYPTTDVPVAHVQGSAVQGMFLHLISEVDPAMAERLHHEAEYRPYTLKDYLSNLTLFHAWYQANSTRKTVSLTRVKKVDLLAYRHYLQDEKRCKTATINQHVASLRSFFSFLFQKEFTRTCIAANPAFTACVKHAGRT